MLFSTIGISIAYAQTPAPAAAPACTGELPVLGKGPNGEDAIPLSQMSLTDAEKAKIKAGNFTAAIAMHMMNTDWPVLQVAGIKSVLEPLGVKVVAVTDGQLKAEKQTADVESIMQMKPDVILAIAVDNDPMAPVFKRAAAAGFKMVMIDTAPTGLVPGKDYVGLGAADNYANGALAADEMATRIGGKGKVAILRWGLHVFQTEERWRGALETLKVKYPDVQVVYNDNVNSVDESASTCENLLTKDPDIKGFWTAWDGMGTACAAAIKPMGKKDVVVTTIDLSTDSGLMIAQDSNLKATGAQHPYDQGMANGMLAAYALIGKAAPPYVVIPGQKVTRDNVVCGMQAVFHQPPSKDLVDAAGPQKAVEVPTLPPPAVITTTTK
jgi:ribose transport system substrate-binding protein